MKSNTPDCMKFKRLQRRLKTGRKETVGLLELLWIATAKNCPQGDIGRFCNEEIAIECDWDGDHDELVAALLECGWLDSHDECRLVVHDWADHAPNHIASNLKRWKKDFIVPREPPKDDPEDDPWEPPKDVTPSLAKPSQARSNLAKPNQSISAAAWAAAEESFGLIDPEEVTRVANRLRKAAKSLPAEFVWQVCCIGEVLSAGMLSEVCTKLSAGDIRKPKTYIEAALRKEAEAIGIEWKALVPLVPKPVFKAVMEGAV